jgi:hypothetical protein
MNTNDQEKFRFTGLLAGAALTILAGWSAWRGHPAEARLAGTRLTVVWSLLGLGAGVALASLVSVRFARGFHRAWMSLARVLARVNTCLLLAVVYLGGFGLYRIWGRIGRRDPLGRWNGPRPSYWVARVRTRQQRWQFERLY